MSVNYGGAAYGGAGYAPPGRVNFNGWISEAFELFKANAGVWIIAGLLVLVVPEIVGGIIGGIFGALSALHPATAPPAPTPSGPFPYGRRGSLDSGLPLPVQLVLQIGGAVYQAYLYGGIFLTANKQVRGEPTDIGDLFRGGPLLLRMLGFNVLYGFAAFIGTLLCIVPGFLLSGLLFPAYALIADGDGVFDAISRSIDGMKKDLWNAAGFIFVMGLLVVVSLLAFCLGEFVTMPMLWLVSVLAYRDMIGMPQRQGAFPGVPSGAYGSPAQPGVWPPPPGAAPPPPSLGQPPYSGPSAYGQPPPYAPPPNPYAPPPNPYAPPPNPYAPPAAPPRTTLGGDDINSKGDVVPPPPDPPSAA